MNDFYFVNFFMQMKQVKEKEKLAAKHDKWKKDLVTEVSNVSISLPIPCYCFTLNYWKFFISFSILLCLQTQYFKASFTHSNWFPTILAILTIFTYFTTI